MINVTTSISQTDKALEAIVQAAYQRLIKGSGKGNHFLGWLDIDVLAPDTLTNDIMLTAENIRKQSDYVVIAGIGGSYLGARAVIDALSSSFPHGKPRIIYAGHHLSEDYLTDLLKMLDTVDYSVVVISKSGTTTETAVAFRLLENHCEQKYGKEASKQRIVCITDKEKGALKLLANQKGYKTYIIPDDVGGRYSVLTPVGLLPIAIAGFNIQALVESAKSIASKLKQSPENNLAIHYARLRHQMLQQGFSMEVMVSFEPKLFYFIEWWKQLFGESEGKENKGLFPAGLTYTTDLHSMGQYMQDGQRMMFETFLSIKQTSQTCTVPFNEENYDKLNFLAGKRISEINRQAKSGTILAHQDGGVPTIEIEIEKLDEPHLGALIYFFEFACGISGYTLGVNPFNQPGVEAYKKNMFALLKKEGYEKEYEILQKRLQKTE